MKMVTFKDDYSHKFTKNRPCQLNPDIDRYSPNNILFISRYPLIIYSTHCPLHHSTLNEEDICVLIIDLEKEKQTGLKLSVGIMKSRPQDLFSLPSLLSVSFHFLTDTYWSGDHDFQLPAFKVTLSRQQGTRLRACPSEGWMGNKEKDQAGGGRKERVKWQACEEFFLRSVQGLTNGLDQ